MTEMKKGALRAVCLLFCLILAAALFSCGAKYDDGEIVSAAKELIADSEAINEIYFGDGLPLVDPNEFLGLLYPSESEDDGGLGYRPVDPSSGYASVDDIKAATLLVYTADYSEILFTAAFTGLSVTVGEGENAERQAVTLARYMDSEYYGTLAGRAVDESEKLPLGRVYDLEGISVVSQRGGTATVSVPSVSRDGEKEDVELVLKMTAEGWRLDTPTY